MKIIGNNDETTIKFNKRVYSTEKNFPEFIKIFHQLKILHNQKIVFDFIDCDVFAGNLCALLGGISYYLSKNDNKLSFEFNSNKKLFVELSENGFLNKFQVNIPSKNQITKNFIPYKEFKNESLDEEKNKAEIYRFDYYIEEEFLKHKDIPRLTGKLYRDFSESLLEIFANAYDHSHNETLIFACGISYPKSSNPRIIFTIVDMGIGFAQNFSGKFRKKYNGEEALKEAIINRKTTKDHPGKLGYKIIKDFIKVNNGKLEVFSNDGYYSLSNEKGENVSSMDYCFDGTIVNLEIKIDHSVYGYSNEK